MGARTEARNILFFSLGTGNLLLSYQRNITHDTEED